MTNLQRPIANLLTSLDSVYMIAVFNTAKLWEDHVTDSDKVEYEKHDDTDGDTEINDTMRDEVLTSLKICDRDPQPLQEQILQPGKTEGFAIYRNMACSNAHQCLG